MKENNMMSYEMYEDFKETMVKTIKTELAAKTANNNQSSDNDLSQRLEQIVYTCLLYTSPSPRDAHESRMPSSA